MEAVQEESGEIVEVRRRMVARARRRGLSRDDAEDLVQDALLKVTRQGRKPGAPGLAPRAFVALRDKQSEHMRAARRACYRSVAWAEVPEREVAVTEPRYELAEMCQMLAEIVGADAMAYVRLKAVGSTEGDIAQILGWSPQRVSTARMRLTRKRADIAKALSRSMGTMEGR